MGFTVVVHHGGAFVGDCMLGYEGGEVHAFHNLDVDNWSYFEALGLIKDLGYREAVKLWWNVGKGRKGKMFKSISCDSHALEMCQYAVDNNCEVYLFVEHTQVSQLVLLEESTLLTFNNEGEKEKEKVEQGVVGDQKLDDEKVEEGDEGNKSEDSFDGDEEYDVRKRETWGWMMDLRRQLLNMMWLRKRVDPEVFRAPDVEGKDTIDGDYVNDELHSDLDEGYGSENNDKPKYLIFQKDEMCRDYKFRLGMEFRSLKEFKETIL
ncbi:hypothetical protein SESBI_06880 [Sesbania bispinosa]|nr:hypothetical protein SESBI_06880 [Sesbania bispinosa]